MASSSANRHRRVTRLLTLLTFCPPGPPLRLAANDSRAAGMVSRGLTYKSSMTKRTGIGPVDRRRAVGLAVAGAATVSRAAADWPRLLGSQFNSVADTDDATLGTIDVTRPPEPMWKIEVGDGYGLGAIAGDRYYQADATADDVGPRGEVNERLRSFDVDTGNEVWVRGDALRYRDPYGYEAGPRGTPAVHGDRVYTMGVTGRLVCRAVDDGREVWSVDTNRRYDVTPNFFGVAGSPLVVPDVDRRTIVIAMVGGDRNGEPDGTLLVAFDASDGAEVWRGGNDLASYSSPRTAMMGETLTVLAFGRGGLWSLDAADGRTRWHHPHRADFRESVNAMVPVVRGREIFISECYQVGGVMLADHDDHATVVWADPPRDRRRQSMRAHWSTPVRVGDHLYGCSGRNAPDCDTRCVRWTDGNVMWRGLERRRTSVTRVGDHGLVWDERGRMTVVRLTPDRYEVAGEWKPAEIEPAYALTYPCWAAPIVVGDRLLIRGDRTVAAFRFVPAASGADGG